MGVQFVEGLAAKCWRTTSIFNLIGAVWCNNSIPSIVCIQVTSTHCHNLAQVHLNKVLLWSLVKDPNV